MGGLTGEASAAGAPGGGVAALNTIVGMGGEQPRSDTAADMILRPSGIAPIQEREQQMAAAKLPPAPQLKMPGSEKAYDAVDRAVQSIKQLNDGVKRLPPAPQLQIKGDAPDTGQGMIDKAQAGLGLSGKTIGAGDTSTQQSSALFEQRVKGTALAGQQPYIDKLAGQYKVPTEVAKAIIALETGWGKSLKGNNPAGIMDPKSPNQTAKVGFKTIEAGLERSMQVIAKNYHGAGGDIHAMNLTYAPPDAKNDPNNTNRFWARDVTSIASRLQPAGLSTITAGRY